MHTLSIGDFQYFIDNIRSWIGKVNECFTTQLHTESSFRLASIDTDNSHTHSPGDLNTHVSNATTGTGNDEPVSRLQPGFL
jgi:hypothetical protein